MTAADVLELEGLLDLASDVVALRDLPHYADACPWIDVIALRHDVDDNPGAIDAAVQMATWEAARGYESTYFILHTARYWDERETRAKLEQIACLRHEIGIHANAIPAALATGETPARILSDALDRLRSWGFDVTGVAPHGDPSCYGPDGALRFVNDEVFTECARPELGEPDRQIEGITLDPRPLADYGLEYEAYRLPRAAYLSDSGNRWTPSIAQARAQFEAGLDAPLQILQHPDWYTAAF